MGQVPLPKPVNRPGNGCRGNLRTWRRCFHLGPRRPMINGISSSRCKHGGIRWVPRDMLYRDKVTEWNGSGQPRVYDPTNIRWDRSIPFRKLAASRLALWASYNGSYCFLYAINDGPRPTTPRSLTADDVDTDVGGTQKTDDLSKNL